MKTTRQRSPLPRAALVLAACAGCMSLVFACSSSSTPDPDRDASAGQTSSEGGTTADGSRGNSNGSGSSGGSGGVSGGDIDLNDGSAAGFDAECAACGKPQ